MERKIRIPPPPDYMRFSPSELFRYFFQIGHWTEESFSNAFQTYTRGTLVSTVTISNWKNRDVIPTRYAGPLFKMIETVSEPQIAKDWVAAFETVWALHSSGRRQTQQPLDTANVSDVICTQHKKWITDVYTLPKDSETFSAKDIYVPLQFHEIGSGETEIFNPEDLLVPTSKTWTLIGGGPGSGKSMSAIHIAASLCGQDVFPIYIRGRHLSDIDIDITRETQSILDSFSVRSFLKHFRASSLQKAFLVLDGLDDISPISHEASNRLRRVLSDLLAEQTACAAHHKTLHIIAFGREPHIEFVAAQIPIEITRKLKLLSLNGALRIPEDTSRHILGQDFRPDWWQKYLAATHRIADPILPDFLGVDLDDFLEFGSDPNLSYFICEAALRLPKNNLDSELPHERVNRLTASSNKNEIYKSIIQQFASGVSDRITQDKFISVLQYIALQNWLVGDGHTTSLNAIYDSLENSSIKTAFEALGLGPNANIGTNTPATSFYLRLEQRVPNSKTLEIDFIHQSLSTYLVSTILFDQFKVLISAFETQKNIASALKAWVSVSWAGTHDPELANFCQKEAALRFDELQELNWNSALRIIKNHLSARDFDGSGLDSLTQFQHANSLLFFLWSCLNLERLKRTGIKFPLAKDDFSFDSRDLRKIQRPSFLQLHSTAFTNSPLEPRSFLTFALSALHFSSVDLSHLSFGLGHMENSIFEDTRLQMTDWRHARVSEVEFSRTFIQHSNFHRWRVEKSNFTDCFFQATRFHGALFSGCLLRGVYFSQCHFSEVEFLSTHFENVVFDRCVFSKSTFSSPKDFKSLDGLEFRYCTFLEMDAAKKNIPIEKLVGTISGKNFIDQSSSAKTNEMQSNLTEFLSPFS